MRSAIAYNDSKEASAPLSAIPLKGIDEVERAISGSLEKALAQEVGRSSGTDIHHIVPKSAQGAEPARNVLISVGIDPLTDSRNKVEISRQFHKFVKSNTYNTAINLVFGPLAEIDDVGQRTESVEGALNILRNLFLFYDGMLP